MTVPYTTSNLISARHGFFGRKGGVSSGDYASLNCGYGSGDERDLVRQNRLLVSQELSLGAEKLAGVYQVHSNKVVEVTPDHDQSIEADAMVTSHPHIGLGVLTADCQPVLFHDAANQVIGAAHAGWRGALDGVLEATVEAMERLGAQRAQITAVIGPCISQQAYEVGPEFLDELMINDPGNSAFFANGTGDRYLFNLPGFGLQRLRACGIAQAEWVGVCTHNEPQSYFSYRRKTKDRAADYGRQISVIRL